MFSVCVLLHGNYVELASRCLSSIYRHRDPARIWDVRIGLNEVSDATLQLARSFADAIKLPCRLYREVNNKNVLKYPMMRRMFYDTDRPLAERVMWFDDDSYLKSSDPVKWWETVDTVWQPHPTLLGSLYYAGYQFTPEELAGMRTEAWYTGQGTPKKLLFVTGGYWQANTAFLQRWDYPIKRLRHNGGDVLLGYICYQQGIKLTSFKHDVAINANRFGHESQAPRRGTTTLRPYQLSADLSHHDFEVSVETYL